MLSYPPLWTSSEAAFFLGKFGFRWSVWHAGFSTLVSVKASMHTHRQYDQRIRALAKRRRTPAQMAQALKKEGLDLAADLHDLELAVEIRCEVLTRAGLLYRWPGSQDRSYSAAAPAIECNAPASVPGVRVALLSSAVIALGGCMNLGGIVTPLVEEDLPSYQRDRVPSLAATYQEPGQRVYRYCRGDECYPTAKVLSRGAFANASAAANTSNASANTGLPPLDIPLTAGARFVDPKSVEKSRSVDGAAKNDSRAQASPIGRVAVFFEFSSSKLNRAALEILRDEAAIIKKAARIVLVGRTDQVGSADRNAHFALKRAEAMKATLISLGIPESIITIETDPQTVQPLHADVRTKLKPGDAQSLARRVDMTLY